MKYKGAEKVRKRLNGVKKNYHKQLKQLPKKITNSNNGVVRMGLKSIKKIC